MEFEKLCQYFDRIENTSGRLEITTILSELFTAVTEDEIVPVLYLLQGRVAPLYEAIELGMAEKTIAKCIAKSVQVDSKTISDAISKSGDIGKTAEEFKKRYPGILVGSMTIMEVFQLLLTTAHLSGPGSQEEKIQMFTDLISRLTPLSCRYIVRIPVGTMRLGFSDMTMLDGLSWFVAGNKSIRPTIERAYHVRPDLGFIGYQIKKYGIQGLEGLQPVVGTPILMMRAERVGGAEEVIEKIGRCSIESKYDGFRVQVHYEHGKPVTMFSRNLENVTPMYPEIAEAIATELDVESVICEGEAIGYDPVTGTLLPFQETVQRKRKYDIEDKVKEIPLKLFCFDVLYRNGINTIALPFEERRSILKETIPDRSAVLVLSHNMVVDTAEEIEMLFDEAVNNGLEGVMAKKLSGPYQPGARGWNWIKFKRSYSSKITDTIDCVVMGYDYGKGKRVDFGIGAFLIGVFEPEEGKYYTVAKIGTGLTDVEWKQLYQQTVPLQVSATPAEYISDKLMDVDVWIRPEIVVEIKADEITRSPVHTAGRKMKVSRSGSAEDVDVPGYALRFPRLERFRTDKGPHDVTSVAEMARLFAAQRSS